VPCGFLRFPVISRIPAYTRCRSSG
jgi:hypothetical protein